MSDLILHATSRNAWTDAKKKGMYAADSLTGEGFIHCSTTGQILRVANLVFAGQLGLVLLVIDPARLTSELRWEPGSDLATEIYPHVYGPINLNAVRKVFTFTPGVDGKFHLPKALKNIDRI